MATSALSIPIDAEIFFDDRTSAKLEATNAVSIAPRTDEPTRKSG
jgi:hypothetical protein